MMTTSPIFILVGNDLHYMPIVWAGALIPLTLIWIANYKLYLRFGFGKKSWIYYLMSYLVIFAFTLLVRKYVVDWLDIEHHPPKNFRIKTIPPFPVVLLVGIVNNSMVIVIQALVRLSIRNSQLVKEMDSLRYLNINAQFQNLKNQVHPHFLFNALSSLKYLVRQNPELAEKYVLKLSDFLRASVESNKKSMVTAESDLQTAMHYLDIQNMRFTGQIHYTNTISSQALASLYLPILTFQTLFENALKHNIISEETPLVITLNLTSDNEIQVVNNLNPKHINAGDHSGTGLSNLNERFELLGGKPLRIEQTDTAFSIFITPFNHEHTHH